MNSTESIEDSRQRRNWSTLGGIALVILGVLAIWLPLATSIGLAIILSWLLIFAGVGHLVQALGFKSVGNFLGELILAAVCFYIGFYMRLHPGLGLSALTFLLAIVFLVSACSEFALYFRIHFLPNTGWILAHAFIDLILFALVLVHWPANSSWLIGTLVGIDLLVAGLSRIASRAPFFEHHRTRDIPA